MEGVARVANAHGLRVDRIDLAFDEVEAANLAARWRRAEHPTGIFTCNDEYGMLLMRALLDAGLVIPGDIAPVGGGRPSALYVVKAAPYVRPSKIDFGYLLNSRDVSHLDPRKRN